MSVNIDFVVNGNNVNSYFKQLEDIPIVWRNRDWTPGFDGFKFGLNSKVPSVPQKNHLVLVAVDSVNHFLGYITRIPFLNKEKLWEFEVRNYLMKLEMYRVNWSTLHSYLNNTADFTGAKTFTVDTVNNEVDCAGHGLSDGDVIQFKSTGTLPAPLQANTYYWVRSLTADSFKIFTILADYSANTNQVDFTDTGTGTHSFALADWTKYQGALEQFGAENVNSAASLKWIVQCIFQIIGAVLDTSLVDNIIFHKFTIDSVEYDWHWDEIYLDENMLFCLNQNTAINPSETDEGVDYIDNQITFLQFIQDLFGKLGLAIKFTGNATTKTYLLIPQARDANGVIQPDDEDYFVVDDKDKVNPIDDTIIDDQGGYSFSRTLHSNRAYYAETTPQEITEEDKTRALSGRLKISWWNNLRFYLHDQTKSGFDTGWLLNPNNYGHEFYNQPNYLAWRNQFNSILNHSREEFECRAHYLSQEKWTVKELKLDIRTRRIKIVQEQNLLASG